MRIFTTAVLAIACLGSAHAQQDVKGQKQLAGGTAKFGTVYSLKNRFNFEILGARYSVDAYNAYYPLVAETDKKLVVIDMAIKNATQSDNFFNSDGFMTLVDDHGALYPSGSLRLASNGSKDASVTLKPGQGVGQADLHDPFELAFQVPSDAKIDKIMVNIGRLNTSEDVVRYMIVPAPKDVAHPTDPNFILPLPDTVRDPSDPSGAVALAQGKGAIGVYVPAGYFDLRVDGPPIDVQGQVGGGDPDDGKKFIAIPFTAKSMMAGDQSFFTVSGAGDPSYSLVNADGDVIKASAFLKNSSNEDADKTFQLGDEYHYRVIFQVPKDGKFNKLLYGTGSSRVWAVDLP